MSKQAVIEQGLRLPEHARAAAHGFDLTELPADFYDDPFPHYHALRLYDPLHRCPDQSIFLSRYADVVGVYLDTERFSSDKKREFKPKFGDSPLFEHHTTSLVFNDPPLHTRVRRLIVGAMTARSIQRMEPFLVELVDRLLDRAETQLQFDGVNDFAALIPIEVIGNMLRIPPQEREPLRDWSLAILGALEPKISAAVFERGNRAVTEFTDYLRVLVADRRKRMSDDEDDILSRLIRGEKSGERLTETELLQNCVFILNAGHETTTNLIANGILELLNHPAEQGKLNTATADDKIAVEELLRYQSPNQLGNRIATEAVTIGGEPFPVGTRITLGIGAANRDPAQFSDPDRLDLGRQPNRHVAFATGPHACAGLNVARLEGRIALARLFRRLPRLRLAGTPVRSRRARFRGLTALPLSVK